jgi:hypothetical protein
VRPAIALLALALLAACHRPRADEPNPGADGEAQARTAAKTLADIQAADAAAQGPPPEIAPVVHHDEPKAKPAPAPVDDATTIAENDAG